jgi:hypothetical protein
MPAAYGGIRFNTYVHHFGDHRWLNVTLYGEYEDLNGAALYKMEAHTEAIMGIRDGRLPEAVCDERFDGWDV